MGSFDISNLPPFNLADNLGAGCAVLTADNSKDLGDLQQTAVYTWLN